MADMDPKDDCVEVIASQFFDKSVRLYSIQRGLKPRVVFKRDIDTQCGAAFATVLADLDQCSTAKAFDSGDDGNNSEPQKANPSVVDAGSETAIDSDSPSALSIGVLHCGAVVRTPPSQASFTFKTWPLENSSRR